MNQVNEELNKSDEAQATEKRDLKHALDDILGPNRERTPEEVDELLLATLQRDREGAALFQKKQRKARWIFRIWLTLSTIGMLVLMGVVGWAYRGAVVQDWDRYGSHSSNCIFKVGERTVKGTREYSYRYYTIFNWRIYNMRTMEEKTFVDMPNNGASVLAHLPDGTHPKVTVKDAEPGRYPLPQAEAYSFFLDNGKNADVVSYRDMCK